MIPDASWNNPEHRLLCLRRATRNADGTVSILTLLLNPTGEDHSFSAAGPGTAGARSRRYRATRSRGDRDVNDNKLNVLSHSAVLVYSRLEPPPQ